MKTIGFICVHNSCRSQIAEFIAKHRYSHLFNACSAGSELATEINPNVVRLIKEIYDVDIKDKQEPKLITQIPKLDVAISMGCNVDCTNINCDLHQDWGIEDPTGKCDEDYKLVINIIEDKMLELAEAIMNKSI